MLRVAFPKQTSESLINRLTLAYLGFWIGRWFLPNHLTKLVFKDRPHKLLHNIGGLVRPCCWFQPSDSAAKHPLQGILYLR